MVKRAKLTLDEPAEASEPSPKVTVDEPSGSVRKRQQPEAVAERTGINIGKAVLVAGLAVALILIFRRKIF